MTFPAFCRALARLDGPFQYTSDLLDSALVRDFLVDFNSDRGKPRVRQWRDVRNYLQRCGACRGAREGAILTYRDYLRLHRNGVLWRA